MSKLAVQGPQLTLAAYEAKAAAANQFRGQPDALEQLRFGLFGEVGGILAAVKKSHRELGNAEHAQVTEEMGDALWYLTAVAGEHKLSLEQVGSSALEHLKKSLSVSHTSDPGPTTFQEFDGLFGFCHHQLAAMERADPLRSLGSNTGLLMARKPAEDLASDPPLATLAKVFADLALVAAKFNVPMASIAANNVQKFESRWPPEGTGYIALFDEDRPSIEQLPREFSVSFIERHTADGKPYVIQRMNGVNIGDRLTDNRTEPDGYRFHDVFHLAYVAHLGWSPVIRGLLKLKRKGDPNLDENQDGARAMIIEEGLATWIFNHAHRRDHYATTSPGKLEYGLLKQVQDMVKGYEVDACPLWQWEKAILEGFNVFRQLKGAKNGSGTIHVSMTEHTLTFEAIEAEPERDAAPPIHKGEVPVGALPLRPIAKP
jgi:NTP pyrophosphatase (non-canonical NTP hydrolase)